MRTAISILFLYTSSLLASAQEPASLPESPAPIRSLVTAPAASGGLSDSMRRGPSEIPAEAKEVEPTPLTMFSHSKMAPYWISGQANSILQAHGRFHSPYEGTNSLRNILEYKVSEVATLYLGYQWHPNSRYNTDFIVDFENAGGRGISQALGLAGATNLDVVRNPNLSSSPYLSRGEIHQTIGLTNTFVETDRSPFSLASEVPVRRFEIRVGKMSMPDTFDINSVGTDSHLQFTNWTIDNNGAWDYAADTRGYTVGGILEYDDKIWSARYGIAAMPVVANGIDLDWAFSRANGQNGEFELRRGLLSSLLNPKRRGTVRILSFVNHAHMGSYREAVHAYLSGQDATPQITLHEHFGAVKYGFGINTDQDVTNSLRLFGRFGWNEDQHESYAYTEVGQSISFGGDYAGRRWSRANDKLGVAFVSNAIKRDHQNYLHYGGLGFLLGDGDLTYAREDILECYYNAHLWRGFYGMLGGSFIAHPGYNRDRGPVGVPAARIHVDF
jgi:high affinity Mn2+ porin